MVVNNNVNLSKQYLVKPSLWSPLLVVYLLKP